MRRQQSRRRDGGKMHFNGQKNPQGWLPPCCPIGHWWQEQLYITTPPDRLNNKKAPATPYTTRPSEADQYGHLGRVKRRGRGAE
jgi:hypothetical protein